MENIHRTTDNENPEGDYEVYFDSFFNLGGRYGWVVNTRPLPLYLRKIDPVSIVHKAAWAPRPVWMGAGNFAPTGFRSADCPASSE
jgi:hypothetical protein